MNAAPTATPAGKRCVTAAQRVWAAGVLSLDPELPAEALAAAALRRLSQDEFVLWRQGELAVRILAGGDECRLSDADHSLLEQAIADPRRAEVDAFCAEYFQLDIDERRRRQTALQHRCADSPVLARRVAHLQTGLNVERPATSADNPELSRLIDIVGRCYLAWPPEAARLRRTYLRELQQERALSERARDLRQRIRLSPNWFQTCSIRCCSPCALDLGLRAHAAQREADYRRTHVPQQPKLGLFDRPGVLAVMGCSLGVLLFLARSCSPGNTRERPVRVPSYTPYIPPAQPGSEPDRQRQEEMREIQRLLQEIIREREGHAAGDHGEPVNDNPPVHSQDDSAPPENPEAASPGPDGVDADANAAPPEPIDPFAEPVPAP